MYLIVGASGFIGKHLYEYCKHNAIDVIGTFYNHPYNIEWIKFNLCVDDLQKVCFNQLNGKNPNAVIVCGATTSIDGCKRDMGKSTLINVDGTKRILKQADHMGVKSVFLSSDAVFDGRKGLYSEEDAPNPITVYGEQKLQIEQYIMQNIKNYLIFRISRATSSRFGENDIFGEFYNKITNQEEIVCLKNQSFCLTEVDDIAKGIVTALKHDINGLFHLSSNNYISRYELARIYAKRMFGGYEKIVEKEYDNIPFLDKRHIYGGLKGSKIADLLNLQYMSMEEILQKYEITYKSI